jgi:lysophospholipase L1-like esterase
VKRIALLAGLLAIALLSACSLLEPEEELIAPPADDYQLDAGSADFSRYVALGNSLSAGYQSGALYASTQGLGWTSQLARAMGAQEFSLPLVADPGFYGTETAGPEAAGHLRLRFDEDGPEVEKTPWPAGIDHYGQLLLDPDRPAPYHNLAVPGSVTYDLAHSLNAADCYTAILAGEDNPYFDLVLRNADIDWTSHGGATSDLTAVDQAILMDPSFITLWIGSNELLLPATRGEGQAIYSAEYLAIFYGEILARLRTALPEAAIVLANVPPVSAAPYFTTFHWYVVDEDGELLPDPATGEPIPLLAEDRPQLEPGDLVLLEAGDDLDLGLGMSEATALLRIMSESGLDSAAAAVGLPERFPRAGEPLGGEYTLIAEEVASLARFTEEYNTVIDTMAAAHGLPLVDAHARMAAAAAHGVDYDGLHLSTEFITGGLFSLDGVHPSSFGHALLASYFIETINAAYGSNLRAPRLADLDPLPPGPLP